jgi:ribosome-binding factor A
MPPIRRADRVSDEVRAAIADLLLRELKDPRIGMVTLTAVEMSADLRHARVFFSVIGDAPARERSLAGLRSAAGFIRREVGRRLQLRFAPEISFELDPGPERAQRLATLLHAQDDEDEG